MLLFDRFELFGFPQTTYICDRKVQLKSLKHMITSRKISQINVFAGSPWEVESVKQLLKSAYITASTEDKGNLEIGNLVSHAFKRAPVRLLYPG